MLVVVHVVLVHLHVCCMCLLRALMWLWSNMATMFLRKRRHNSLPTFKYLNNILLVFFV